ncbi:dynein regulatory complex subunit 2 [Agrilus planipennis]|uniref:Dynein regulatory complex subunit 2 n=1 Tax=Agrilus planipennis TaxID=224129 RepID=A0A1W4WPU6_AGRPL|nr:dynein regulatory complex subunit 2 [Agrilus planipennis]
MGRKSKKSIANKLAKMSDEERAKYIQKKADAEEEIKRRREQLIATFVKNKLKREEGYGRLNLAKINQHWHQLLRMQKCKHMKEEVGHLKKWIGRVYILKEKTINNLIDELKEAETQLQNSFQTHAIRINKLIDQHNEYMKKMHSQYEKDREELIETLLNENRNVMEKFLESRKFLKCIIYGNDEKLERNMKENTEKHVKNLTSIVANVCMPTYR